MSRVAFGVVLLLLSGCGYALKGAAEYPSYIKCKGKGTISGAGQTSLIAGLGGAGQNTFHLTLDCGEGITWQQGKEPPAEPPVVPSLPPAPPK